MRAREPAPWGPAVSAHGRPSWAARVASPSGLNSRLAAQAQQYLFFLSSVFIFFFFPFQISSKFKCFVANLIHKLYYVMASSNLGMYSYIIYVFIPHDICLFLFSKFLESPLSFKFPFWSLVFSCHKRYTE
jgi:hypothetical protein